MNMKMTNDKAKSVINELKLYVEDLPGYSADEVAEALEMSIKALEIEPCDDCISRADILDAIETWDKFGVNAEQKLIRWKDHYVPYVHLDDVRNAIANMPSVTPSIPDVENNYNIGYNCGYTDAMFDIAERR